MEGEKLSQKVCKLKAGCMQDVMKRTRTAEDHARWARCLGEVVKSAAPLCPSAARAACQEVCAQLQAIPSRRKMQD